MSDPYPFHVIRSARKTIAMSLTRDGKLVIKAPFFTPEWVVRKFVTEHTSWIDEHTKRHAIVKPTFKVGDVYLYLGNEYVYHPGTYTEIGFINQKLQFPQALVFRAEKELRTYYQRQAKDIITERVEWYAKELKTTYTDLTFSDTKSQWGRCTQDNRLQFNWRLVMTPLLTINYVVVHELVHTMEKNHSQAFWSKVRHFNPSYRQQQKWLKENQERVQRMI